MWEFCLLGCNQYTLDCLGLIDWVEYGKNYVQDLVKDTVLNTRKIKSTILDKVLGILQGQCAEKGGVACCSKLRGEEAFRSCISGGISCSLI